LQKLAQPRTLSCGEGQYQAAKAFISFNKCLELRCGNSASNGRIRETPSHGDRQVPKHRCRWQPDSLTPAIRVLCVSCLWVHYSPTSQCFIDSLQAKDDLLKSSVIIGQGGIIAVYPAAHARARLRSPKTCAGPMRRSWSRLCNLSIPAKSPYYAVQYSILYEPPKADGFALWVLACFHKIRRASERCMCVSNRRARDALKIVRRNRSSPRTYATSLRTFSERSSLSGRPFKGHPTVESTGRYGKIILSTSENSYLKKSTTCTTKSREL
jgi:hypothetical protein